MLNLYYFSIYKQHLMATVFNEMQAVKRRFFAMRNGIIADSLRKGGSTFHIIFGLNLPQIVEIAKEIGIDPALGRQLWENRTTRESRLLAPMIMSPSDFTSEEILEMCGDIDDIELADIFCHRFLRHYPTALSIARRLSTSDRELDRYIALRLMFNLLNRYPTEAKELAMKEAEFGDKLTRNLALRLMSELEN